MGTVTFAFHISERAAATHPSFYPQTPLIPPSNFHASNLSSYLISVPLPISSLHSHIWKMYGNRHFHPSYLRTCGNHPPLLLSPNPPHTHKQLPYLQSLQGCFFDTPPCIVIALPYMENVWEPSLLPLISPNVRQPPTPPFIPKPPSYPQATSILPLSAGVLF